MRKDIYIEDLHPGSGPTAERGQSLTIRYSGWLNRGDKFQENVTITFRVGSREVIPGLSFGVEGMRVGKLAYGATGVPGVIPANAVLVFEVELVEASDHTLTQLEQKHAEG